MDNILIIRNLFVILLNCVKMCEFSFFVIQKLDNTISVMRKSRRSDPLGGSRYWTCNGPGMSCGRHFGYGCFVSKEKPRVRFWALMGYLEIVSSRWLYYKRLLYLCRCECFHGEYGTCFSGVCAAGGGVEMGQVFPLGWVAWIQSLSFGGHAPAVGGQDNKYQ